MANQALLSIPTFASTRTRPIYNTMHPRDGKNVFVFRAHRSPSNTHSLTPDSLSLSSLLQSWHGGISKSDVCALAAPEVPSQGGFPSLPSNVPAACQNVPGSLQHPLLRSVKSLVPLSYLPLREERSREQIAGAGAAGEGVGIPRKTVAQYPNYRKSRFPRRHFRIRRCCAVVATRFKFRPLTHPQISNAKLSIRQGTNRLLGRHFHSTRQKVISAPFPSFCRHLSIHSRHDCF